MEEMNEDSTKDEKYKTTAKTATMSRFGPSGSFKSAKNALEHMIDVNPKIIWEALFDLKFMLVYCFETQ